MHAAVALLLVLVTSSWSTSQRPVREKSTAPDDDQRVLAAAFAHSRILGEAEQWSRWSKIESPVFLVVRDSVPICADPRDESRPCLPREYLQQCGASVQGHQQRFGMDFRAAVQEELTRSFEQRNKTSSSLPPFADPRIQFIEYERLLPSLESYRGRARGYASFSRPGYSADGTALVYASYVCGGTCGNTWLFLLARIDDGWRVVHLIALTEF